MPSASLIVAAYNEEQALPAKLANSSELSYPREKLDIIVFSDGSTDNTDAVVRASKDERVRLLRIEGRKGKTHCQNRAAEVARGDILVFSDGNSMYERDALLRIVDRFADPQVGCVCGELRYVREQQSVEGETLYWRYEQLLKRGESRVSSLIAANGAIYAVRRDIFVPLNDFATSDFVEPLKILLKGYRVVYEPSAVAWEATSSDALSELQRRTRIVTRCVRSLTRDRHLLGLLNPYRHGAISVQLWFHKVLRWFSGFLLPPVLALNILLLGSGLLYVVTLGLQVLFYSLALLGFAAETLFKRQARGVPHIAYYFCLSCYGMACGLVRGLVGRKIVVWKPLR
jgi:cellulose synthase/poly-beta-1,6-N-acetylglucosamine synthase-like glycosyltransferase